MDNLNVEEKIELVRLRGDNDRTLREVCEIFNNRHPNRPNITKSTVYKINKIFNECGAVTRRIIRTDNVQRRPRYEQTVLNYFNNNPNASVRVASLDLNLPRENIRRCLKKNKVKPFKPKFLHTLEPGDDDRRMEFCLWAQGEYLNNRNFKKTILLSDEATFTTNGVVSSQNSRFWAIENPEWVINCKRQYSQKVNVWCGLLNETIIGPFFFEGNMNSMQFLQFLRNEFWNILHELSIQERVNLHFQLDGSPVHNARVVTRWLNANFPNRWIGRGSPLIGWPPRSPDLTPLDFFLWGLIKSKVYRSRPNNREDLCARIRQACAEVTRQQLQNVVKNIKKRFDKCIEINGGLVEATKI